MECGFFLSTKNQTHNETRKQTRKKKRNGS